MNAVGMEFILICDTIKDNNDKALCRDRLETILKDNGGGTYTNATDFVKYVFKRVFDEGSCRDKNKGIDHLGMDRDTVRGLLGLMVMGETTRQLVPALLARMLRCDEETDWPTFKHIKKLVENSQISTANCTSLSSNVLQVNVGLSEMYVSSTDTKLETRPCPNQG